MYIQYSEGTKHKRVNQNKHVIVTILYSEINIF